MEFNKKINLALDCDEVLTYISPLWVYFLHQDYERFSKWFKLSPVYDIKKNFNDILYRDEFALQKFLKRDDVDENDKEFQRVLNEEFFEIIKIPKFYQLCKPTKMAKALADISITPYINKVYIISRVVSDDYKVNEAKKKFLESIFKDSINKLEDIIFLQMGESKGDIIHDLNCIDVYYDDELSNVIDVMNKKDKEKGMDIYIPRLNYNQPSEDLIDLGLNTSTCIKYYDAVDGI